MKILRFIFSVLVVGFIGCTEPDHGGTANTTIASLGLPPDNEIWFHTTDGRRLISFDDSSFDTEVLDIIYSEADYNIIRFADIVTTIGEGAFENCHNLFNISLPNSITTIEERAFAECRNMECLTLGAKIKSCGKEAFDFCVSLYSLHILSVKHWCGIEFQSPTANPLYYSQMLIVNGEKLQKLNIPVNTTKIGSYAFCNNYYLKEVSIPASMQSVGKSAFEGCDNITKVETEDIEAWSNIDFENETANPLHISCAIYSKGDIITDLSLSTTKRVNSHAFICCSSITSLTTSNTVESIGLEAFRGCNSLANVMLGANTAEIGAKAFTGCTVLSNVTSLATQPPLLGDKNVFAFNAEDRKFRVPSKALSKYLSDSMWSIYADTIEALE